MINHMYMQGHKRRPRNSDYIRTYAPYAATALLIIVLFWGVDSIKQDSQRRQYEPTELVQPPPKDWTHKLSTSALYDDKGRPDDDTTVPCPLPIGNWGHTCDREVTIEGPCNGKCMLKARCQDVKEKFKETTFEYNEGRKLEIKNVNGLLCSIEDGSPSCGVNFHGNLALKNCQGYVPRRHEIIIDGLYVDVKAEKKDDDHAWDDGKDPDDEDDDDDSWRKKKNKPHDDDTDYDVKRPKRKYFDENFEEDRRMPKRPIPRREEVRREEVKRDDARRDDLGDDLRDVRPQKRTFDEFEEHNPKLAPRRAPLPQRLDDDIDKRAHRKTDDADAAGRYQRGRYQDPDAEDDADEDRLLRGNPRRFRFDDDERPPRRHGIRDVA